MLGPLVFNGPSSVIVPILLAPDLENYMLIYNKLITTIKHMLDFLRRWGPHLLTSSLVSAGIAVTLQFYIKSPILAAIFWVFSGISFPLAVYFFISDFVNARKVDEHDKHPHLH